jgi:hypothetical protein
MVVDRARGVLIGLYGRDLIERERSPRGMRIAPRSDERSHRAAWLAVI